MGKKSRTKGAAFEREIAKAMRPHWVEARRGGHDQAGPHGSPDVDGTPYWVECKRYRKITRGIILAAHEQADRAADRAHDDRPTLVVTRSDNEKAQCHFRAAKTLPDTGALVVVIASVPFSEWLDAVKNTEGEA